MRLEPSLKPYKPECPKCGGHNCEPWGWGHFLNCPKCKEQFDPYADLDEPDMADDTPEKARPTPAEPEWAKVARERCEANKERLRRERLEANKSVLRSYRIKP